MSFAPFRIVPPRHVTASIGLEPVYNALTSLALLTADVSPAEVEPWVLQTGAGLTPEQCHRNRLVFEGLGEALILDEDYPDFPAYLEALAAVSPTSLRDRMLQRLSRPTHEWRRPEDQTAATDPATLLADAQKFVDFVARRYPDDRLDRALQIEVHTLLGNPGALRQLIVTHLRDMWETALAAEWHRRSRELANLVNWLQRRDWPAASAADTIRTFIGRDLPDAISAQLSGVQRVVFVLSPHVRLHASRFGSDTTIWVFVLGRFFDLKGRQSPITRGELIGPLSALADDTRLRIMELLAQREELTAQEIIAQLQQSQPNVSRHLKQLCSTGFVVERRGEGGNKCYRLNPKRLDATFRSLKQLLSAENTRAVETDARDEQPAALRRFLDRSGRITTWPARKSDQDEVLSYLASKFMPGRDYSESEVNDLLKQWHTYQDHATLRRDLYDARLLDRTRDGARYWRTTDDVGS